MSPSFSLAGVLTALWLLLSGHTSLFLLSLGILSIVLTVLVARRLDLLDEEGHPIRLAFGALFYWPWLIKEIVVANIDVAIAILKGAKGIHPNVFTVKASQESDLGRVTYANSITLTPGTVTIGLEGDVLTVHALTRESADGVKSGDMDARVTAFVDGDLD